MTITKTTPSEPTGTKPIDPLVDYDCVILDGYCDCIRLPGNTFPECKKYGEKKNVDI